MKCLVNQITCNYCYVLLHIYIYLDKCCTKTLSIVSVRVHCCGPSKPQKKYLKNPYHTWIFTLKHDKFLHKLDCLFQLLCRVSRLKYSHTLSLAFLRILQLKIKSDAYLTGDCYGWLKSFWYITVYNFHIILFLFPLFS